MALVMHGFPATFKSGTPFAILYREDAHVPLANQLEGLWECRELLQRSLGRNPGRKRISLFSKHHRMHFVEMFQT